MAITISREGHVTVNNDTRRVDCSALPVDQEIVYWNGNKGYIQFVQSPDVTPTTFRLNETIDSFEPYQWALDAWTANPPPPPEPPPPPPGPSPEVLVLFGHEARLRVIEGQPPITLEAFIDTIQSAKNTK